MADTEAQDSEAQGAAQQEKDDREEAREVMKKVEEDPPDKLEDWPGGKAKYMTMGGSEGDEGYEDGPTAKLGPSDLRHHEDGSVTIGGEEVDDPDEYKGEPIPGGPTDPEAKDPAMLEHERGEKTEHAADGPEDSSGDASASDSDSGDSDEDDSDRSN